MMMGAALRLSGLADECDTEGQGPARCSLQPDRACHCMFVASGISLPTYISVCEYSGQLATVMITLMITPATLLAGSSAV
jgi:hypothetical protein